MAIDLKNNSLDYLLNRLNYDVKGSKKKKIIAPDGTITEEEEQEFHPFNADLVTRALSDANAVPGTAISNGVMEPQTITANRMSAPRPSVPVAPVAPVNPTPQLPNPAIRSSKVGNIDLPQALPVQGQAAPTPPPGQPGFVGNVLSGLKRLMTNPAFARMMGQVGQAASAYNPTSWANQLGKFVEQGSAGIQSGRYAQALESGGDINASQFGGMTAEEKIAASASVNARKNVSAYELTADAQARNADVQEKESSTPEQRKQIEMELMKYGEEIKPPDLKYVTYPGTDVKGSTGMVTGYFDSETGKFIKTDFISMEDYSKRSKAEMNSIKASTLIGVSERINRVARERVYRSGEFQQYANIFPDPVTGNLTFSWIKPEYATLGGKVYDKLFPEYQTEEEAALRKTFGDFGGVLPGETSSSGTPGGTAKPAWKPVGVK